MTKLLTRLEPHAPSGLAIAEGEYEGNRPGPNALAHDARLAHAYLEVLNSIALLDPERATIQEAIEIATQAQPTEA